MKTILLCGATGYLGSRLLSALISDYRILVAKRSFSRMEKISHLLSDCKTYDIDQIPLELIFKENQIDVILNAAGNYGRKGETISEITAANLVFPITLLEYAKTCKVPYFIQTDTVLAQHVSAYALSKYQCSQWLEHFSKKLTICNLKLENFYGPGDDPTKFIGFVMKQILTRQKEIKLTSGEQIRDFIFIDDVTAFYTLLLKELDGFSAGLYGFHVGTGTPHRIRDVVEFLIDQSKSPIKPLYGAIPDRKGETIGSIADIPRLEKMGFRVSTDLFTGLRKTWEMEIAQHQNSIGNECKR